MSYGRSAGDSEVSYGDHWRLGGEYGDLWRLEVSMGDLWRLGGEYEEITGIL